MRLPAIWEDPMVEALRTRRQPMKSLTRFCLLCLAVLATASHAAAPDPSLLGCWRAARIVQFSEGGSKVEDTSGRCTLRFTEDQLASTCATSRGTVTSTYSYRIVRPGFYAATMASSTFQTSLIGSTREYEYHVDADRLTTATNLHGTGTAPAVALRVETQAARTPCP